MTQRLLKSTKAALVAGSLALPLALPLHAPANPHGDAQREALYYTNQARHQHGLGGLSPSAGLEPVEWGQPWGALQQAAHNHAKDMANRNYFSHLSPEGLGPGERLSNEGYRGAWAENIFCGSGSAGAALKAWMESDGHRANILRPNFSSVGIAHYYNASSSCQHYWVMILGNE